MNRYIRENWISAISALLVLPIGGCIIICNSCGTPKHKAEHTVTASANMAAEGFLSAQTHNGNISVQGQDLSGCEVTAHITARGDSQQEAADLARAVEVSLIQTQQGLSVDIKKPDSGLSKHINVSLDIKMPAQSRMDMKTSNGNINVNHVILDVALHTSNGDIHTADTPGPITANTSNGTVTCRDAARGVQAHTSNGNIDVVFGAAAEIPNRIDLKTSNGSISITPPQAFSGKVDAWTSNGKIRTDRAITVAGDFSNNELHGTIGDGKDTCRLNTSNGSIHIH